MNDYSHKPKLNRIRSRKRQRRFTYYFKTFLSLILFTTSTFYWVLPTLANTPAGTTIDNTATGSFEDPDNLGTKEEVTSNTVSITIAEVAGITISQSALPDEAPNSVTNAGPNQNDGNINPEDVVYFTYKMTNVGNDPTQFFIPGAPSSISNGSLSGDIEIIEYDPDGSGATAATDLSGSPVTVPSSGINTGDAAALNLPNGSIPPNGTVTIRVPIKVDSNVNNGDMVTVIMGDTGSNDNSASTQNQVFSAGTNDLYTQDNGDGDGITSEQNGNPANGDATNHRQEASYQQEVEVVEGISTSLDYGDAPDTYGTDATAANSSNSNDPVGASHGIISGIHLGTNPPDAETDAPTPLDGSGDGADEDGITLLPLTAGSIGYAVPPADITATGTGTLHAWVDFDKNGTFDPSEYTSVAINSGTVDPSGLSWSGITVGSAGNTYARFRFTSDTSINANTPGGAASDGEVEDYSVAIATSSGSGNICANPLSAAFNTSGYALNTALQSNLSSGPLSFYGGSMLFDASLDGTATWNDGIQVQTDSNAGDVLYLQPKNASDYLNTGNAATYVLSFPNSVTNFSMRGSGLNRADATTISASYQGVPIPITAANFSDLDPVDTPSTPGMYLIDNDGSGPSYTVVGDSTAGGVSVNTNIYTLTIPGLVDKITIVSGKNSSSTATATIGIHSFSYCLDPVISSDPNVLLVKRITAINSNTTTNGGEDLAIYNQDNSDPYDDNKLDTPEPDPIDTNKWFDTVSDTSSGFLIGGINGGKVKPDDEIEYTIYFLSAGDVEAKNVLICDRIPENVTFLPGTFNSVAPATGGITGSSRGILWFKDGNTQSLTNGGDADAGQYFAPGVDPATVYPTVNCGGINTNGAVVVNLGNLPNATAPGNPNTSYGYIRFRGKVK